MDFTKIMEQLNQASPFELYRLTQAIYKHLQSEETVALIKSKLVPGQLITYFDGEQNRLIEARVIKLNRSRLLVQHVQDRKKWIIPYYFVNVDNIDPDLKPGPENIGLSKNQLQVGATVGYLDHQNREVYGKVRRLNQKTATVDVIEEGSRWRVPYSMLFPVLETNIVQDKLEN
ncbi:MAG: hypothetical protein R6U22_01295 [Desulfohalobiaceae bacterium]